MVILANLALALQVTLCLYFQEEERFQLTFHLPSRGWGMAHLVVVVIPVTVTAGRSWRGPEVTLTQTVQLAPLRYKLV